VHLVQETKNLIRLTRFGMVNCFLVREDDGLTLVDTGPVQDRRPAYLLRLEVLGRQSAASCLRTLISITWGVLGRARP